MNVWNIWLCSQLADQDNQYDMDTLKEFIGQVGLNLEEVLTRIGDIPKLY